MEKKRSRLADYAVYVFVRFVVCIVQVLSWQSALSLAGALAWLAYRVSRRYRMVAADNVRHAFPDLDEQTVDRLVPNYLHLTTMMVEMIRLPRVMHRHNVYDYVQHADAGDLPLVRSWVATGRPILMLLGHFGNWEIFSYSSGMVGFRALVARRIDNPYLDRFVSQFRHKTGIAILDKNLDYDRILQTLADGKTLGMVADQDAGPRGLFVDFLGRPASTFKSIALLSLEYNAPIFVFGTARVGQPMRYTIYLEDLILPEDYAARTDATRAITERYTRALERLVRRHPEQYFWLHRRWKSRPPERKTKKAA